ncbi:MAG: outer membrane protein assembly factor BamD [Planctomycetes bacterium]|nr:outer membrane protein assembly factor BamD [Planctomycetota bacterium]
MSERVPVFLGIFFAAALGPAAADWIWTPENGWVNTSYGGREAVGTRLDEARALQSAGRHAEAAELYSSVLEEAEPGSWTEEALFQAGESDYQAGNYYRAHINFERLLTEYPATPRLTAVMEREYRVGSALVRGEKKKELFWPIEIASKEEGVEILRQVVELYPLGEFADDARFTIANYYFQEGRFLEAMEEYRALREEDEYKNSEWREVALFQIARCQEAPYEGPRYDVTPLKEAVETYRNYQAEAPEGSKVPEARAREKEIALELAKNDFLVAKWYLQWDRPKAAAVLLREIVELHPDAPEAEEARELLSELGNP